MNHTTLPSDLTHALAAVPFAIGAGIILIGAVFSLFYGRRAGIFFANHTDARPRVPARRRAAAAGEHEPARDARPRRGDHRHPPDHRHRPALQRSRTQLKTPDVSSGKQARRACGGGCVLPALRATRRLARGRGGEPAQALSRAEYWARPVPGLRRSRRRRSSSSAWRRRRTAPTAPGACSPATARATGCSRRCTAPGYANQPTSSERGDGLRLTGACDHRGRCAARRRPTSPRRPSATPACRPGRASCALLARGAGRCSRSARSAGTAPCAALAALGHERPAAEAEVRPRGRGAGRARTAARLLPPEPAEHLHRQAHRADARRRDRPRARAWRPVP